jgi:putative ABC transport system substrate-binding protein
MMTRRGIMAASLGLLAARASAQSNNPPLVGALFLSDLERSYNWKHLKIDLQELGYTDGANIRYAARSSYDAAELPKLAAQIAELSPAVVYANGDEPARVAARQWTTTPIVALTDDHIGAGLTDSYAHPSRNITGISRLEAELDTKRLEILHELVLPARVILVLRDPQTTWPERGAELDRAADHMGIELVIRDVRETADIDVAVAAGPAAGATALLVLGSPLLSSPRFDDHIRQAAIGSRLPTMVQISSLTDKLGSLASYGADQDALLLRLAEMLERILKGARPDSIPIEQPTKFRLIVNLKTANAIGLEVPSAVLARADEVIE